MRDVIDPLADNIFDAVGITLDKGGTIERAPQSDEDWEKIRVGNAVEGAIPVEGCPTFAPPGDVNNSTGPDAAELSPDRIVSKLQNDPVEWDARIEALRTWARGARYLRRKDVQELWTLRRNLDAACAKLPPKLLVPW